MEQGDAVAVLLLYALTVPLTAGLLVPGVRRRLAAFLIRSHVGRSTIAAGQYHSLFVNKGGAVLSCGYGWNGRLGHGDEETQLVPKLVAALEGRRVVQVAAGAEHSLFLTEGAAALSCGSGEVGRLGHGDVKNRLVPKAVSSAWC